MAECILGNGDRAYEYYRSFMPAAYNDKAEIRQIEPYVQGQTTYSVFSPRAGNARTSWLTGAAPWAYYSATQYMLGIKPEHNGLRIDPCIPKKWDGYKVIRRFRGATYNITVKNPNNVSTGIKQINVNGSVIDGTILPIVEKGKTREVEVIMG